MLTTVIVSSLYITSLYIERRARSYYINLLSKHFLYTGIVLATLEVFSPHTSLTV